MLLRNPQGVQPLVDQLTFVSWEDDPKVGLMGMISNDWAVLGIHNDGSERGLSRAIDESTAAGTGFGVLSYAYKPGAVTGSAEIIDENPTIDYIKWPDRVVKDNGVVIERNTGKVAMGHVLMVDIRQDDIVALRVTREKAALRIDEQGRGQEPKATTVNIAYRTDEHKAIFETRYFKVTKDGELVELDVRRFVEDSKIVGDLDEGTKIQLGEGKPEEIQDAQDRVPNEDGTPASESPAPAETGDTETGNTEGGNTEGAGDTETGDTETA